MISRIRYPDVVRGLLLVFCFMGLNVTAATTADKSLSILLVSGQANKAHNWEVSHKVIAERLLEADIFSVDVVLTPPAGESLVNFAPSWSKYDAVVLDYEGMEWPEPTKKAFENYIASGGGLVVVHAADNAFPYWDAYNKMIAVGGWGNAAFHTPPLNPGQPEKQKGRDESFGPRIFWEVGRLNRDDSAGKAFHPPKHDFLMTVRAPDHPITKGLPDNWMHGSDEIYSGLRGPAQNVTVLATAIADPAFARPDRKHEPMLMTVKYGKGRVFHMTLGHVGKSDGADVLSMRNVGFITLLQRGTEWAATGAVTQLVPDDFPSAYQTSFRAQTAEGWHSLLDPQLSQFETFIGVPHSSVEGLPQGTFQSDDVTKGTPLGLGNDPLNVFRTYQHNGETILAISGEIYGCIVTKKAYTNYHLQAKFRWLHKKWEPRLQKPRDSGILFHSYGEHGAFWQVWKKSLEFQIQEKDNGDFITLGGVTADLPYEPKGKQRSTYDPSQKYRPFKGYLSAYPEPDRSHGNWNTIDLYVHGDKAIFVVNGKVVMSLKNAKNHEGQAMTKGQIQIQSEGAEMEYKRVRIRLIEALPLRLKQTARL